MLCALPWLRRGSLMLTDDQCDEFLRLPLSFKDMVRAIYQAGRTDALEEAAKACDLIEGAYWDGPGAMAASECADRIRRMAEGVKGG